MIASMPYTATPAVTCPLGNENPSAVWVISTRSTVGRGLATKSSINCFGTQMAGAMTMVTVAAGRPRNQNPAVRTAQPSRPPPPQVGQPLTEVEERNPPWRVDLLDPTSHVEIDAEDAAVRNDGDQRGERNGKHNRERPPRVAGGHSAPGGWLGRFAHGRLSSGSGSISGTDPDCGESWGAQPPCCESDSRQQRAPIAASAAPVA